MEHGCAAPCEPFDGAEPMGAGSPHCGGITAGHSIRQTERDHWARNEES